MINAFNPEQENKGAYIPEQNTIEFCVFINYAGHKTTEMDSAINVLPIKGSDRTESNISITDIQKLFNCGFINTIFIVLSDC